jgi:GTP-binding protein LepA
VLTSAKSGIGIADVLEGRRRPHPARPRATATRPAQGLLVDSWYDPYLGVVILVRVIDGVDRKGLNVKFMQGGTST